MTISGNSLTLRRIASSTTSFCGNWAMMKATSPWNPAAYPISKIWSSFVLTLEFVEYTTTRAAFRVTSGKSDRRRANSIAPIRRVE
jgi:hypothetical protein